MNRIALLLAAAAAGCVEPPNDVFTGSDSFRREIFEQSDALPSDVLFVIDSSCSMEDEQEALASNFPAFARFFVEEALEFRIAVTTTNIGEPDSEGLDGAFVDGTWLDEATEDLAEAFIDLALVGIDPNHGDEVGLTAAHAAIAVQPQGADFLRADSHLAIIAVSDEPDWSTTPAGEATGAMVWTDFVAWLDTAQGEGNEDLTDLSAIVGISEDGFEDPSGCGGNDGTPGVGAMRGDGYLEAASESGGSWASICDADWEETLERIGLRAAGLSDHFSLAEEPVADSLDVRVGGVRTEDWYFRPFDNAVVFASAAAVPRPREEIQVSYHVETAARE